MPGWIGFDLDGTLAKYNRWEGPLGIGEPISEIVEIAKAIIEQGTEVRVFTARVSVEDENVRSKTIEAIADWTEQQGLGRLVATNKKDYEMITCYDDRCVQVFANEGILLQNAFLQLQEAYRNQTEELELVKSALNEAQITT